jgi:hypothetical protein
LLGEMTVDTVSTVTTNDVRLCQVLALEGRARQRAEKTWQRALLDVTQAGPFDGVSKTYRPKVDDGPKYPPDSTKVQLTVGTVHERMAADLGRWWDLTATRDKTNTGAVADVVVEDVTLIKGAPASFLVWFEKQLAELRKVLDKTPVLDPAYEWSLDQNTGLWRAPEEERHKTKLVLKNHVRFKGDQHHPPQVDVYEDKNEIEGYWDVVKTSGAMQQTQKDALIERLDRLIEAVTIAREKANQHPVIDLKVGGAVFEYILGATAA